MRPRWIFLVTTLIFSKSAFSATSDRIVDPYADENLNCHEKPDGRLRYLSKSFGFDYFRIRADLNFDGREDVILTTEDPSCGNGGCSTAVYLKQSDGSYAVAYLGLHPEKVRLRRGKNGGGEIQTYWTDTASTGTAKRTCRRPTMAYYCERNTRAARTTRCNGAPCPRPSAVFTEAQTAPSPHYIVVADVSMAYRT